MYAGVVLGVRGTMATAFNAAGEAPLSLIPPASFLDDRSYKNDAQSTGWTRGKKQKKVLLPSQRFVYVTHW